MLMSRGVGELGFFRSTSDPPDTIPIDQQRIHLNLSLALRTGLHRRLADVLLIEVIQLEVHRRAIPGLELLLAFRTNKRDCFDR
mgnify:CR=1 FL=1